jgi:hypothetical protein
LQVKGFCWFFPWRTGTASRRSTSFTNRSAVAADKVTKKSAVAGTKVIKKSAAAAVKVTNNSASQQGNKKVSCSSC